MLVHLVDEPLVGSEVFEWLSVLRLGHGFVRLFRKNAIFVG